MSNLASVPAGSSVRVQALQGHTEQANRLRELGFCENAVVRCLQSGSACVCVVDHARIALSAQLASQILVEPVA